VGQISSFLTYFKYFILTPFSNLPWTNYTHGTLTLHHITVALLGLRLDVAGVGILDAVVEGVLGIGHRLGVDGMDGVRQDGRMVHQRRGVVAQLDGDGLSGGEQQSDGNKVLERGEVSIRIGDSL